MLRIYFYSLIMLLGNVIFQPYAYADDNQDLQTVRQSIREQEKMLSEQKKRRFVLISDLEKQETAIAKLLTSLDKSDQTLTLLAREISALNPEIKELEKTQAKQREILAKQLESAFKLGKTSNMELIFSGTESERNERIINYYGYINQERQHRINELKLIQDNLSQKKNLLEQKHNTQRQLQDKQKEEHQHLIVNQMNRQQTISALDKSMQVNQQRLDELKENEARLQTQITKAEKKNKKIAEDEAKQASQIQTKQQNYNYKPTKDEKELMARVSGIGKPTHLFTWPVTGNILHHFGETQQGELRWKGLVIASKEGSKVKAIADGRVILASWLQGYGFIVALDHGKGDMTLYGYNQRVLVNVGDNIQTGQDIALVGTTGGQGRAALYFEVRRDGRALDPSAWLKK